VNDRLLQRPTAIVLIWMSLRLLARPAEIQSYVPNKDLAIGYGAIAAGVVTLIYSSINEGHFIKGCTVSSQSGLQLQDEGNNRTYMLLGVTANIQPGDRIRLKGKKSTKDSSGNRVFLVQQIVKEYGHCKVQPATPYVDRHSRTIHRIGKKMAAELHTTTCKRMAVGF
jgi:hypothetical protein